MTTSTRASWTQFARDAVTLKPEPFQKMSAAASIKKAVLLVVVVGLIIGAVQALVGIPGLFRSMAVSADEITGQFDQVFDPILPFMPSDDADFNEFMDMYRRSIESFAPTIEAITSLPTPLPGFFGRLFTWLGGWLSQPFTLLASWLSISIWIMLFARLLGGRGGLLAYLSASSLSVIPHLLGAFAFIPCLGGTLALVGSIWGLVIQVKVVETTHGLTQGRSILAVLLPYLLIVLLIGLGITMFFLFIILAAGAGA